MALLDYHTHTYLCEHASGTIDDYINSAIAANLSELGFSDHAPLPKGMREGITMLPEDTELYINLIEQKKDANRDKIDIKIGFEVDYPFQESFDKRYLTDYRIDYLIGSCHYLAGWAFDQNKYIDEFENRDIDEIYSEYYSIITDIAKSGFFNIIGHFDLVKKFGHRPKTDLKKIIEKTVRIISEMGITVEISTAGLRKPVKEIYPDDNIIDLLYNMNVPITLASDSHSPDEVGYMFHLAVEKIKRAGYNKISGFHKRKRYDIVI